MFTLDDILLLPSWLFAHLLIAFFVFFAIHIALMHLSTAVCLRLHLILTNDLMTVYEAGNRYMCTTCWPSSFADILLHFQFSLEFLRLLTIIRQLLKLLLMVHFAHVLLDKSSCLINSLCNRLEVIMVRLNQCLEKKCKVRARLQEWVRILNTYLL